jgi:hypothetical protein
MQGDTQANGSLITRADLQALYAAGLVNVDSVYTVSNAIGGTDVIRVECEAAGIVDEIAYSHTLGAFGTYDITADTFTPNSAGGVDNFLDLTDTPDTYTGQGTKIVSVNSGETALEFIANSFLNLTDTPNAYTSQALKDVRVNAAATGLEFYTTAHGFSVGNVVRIDGEDTYLKAQADNLTNSQDTVGMVSAVADANNFTLTMYGLITGLSGFTPGTLYYLDASTAGALTATAPALAKPVFVSIDATSGYVINQLGATAGISVSRFVMSQNYADTGFNPLDATPYYVGGSSNVPSTTDGTRRIYFESAATIKSFTAKTFLTVNGSGENVTLYARIDATTDNLIGTMTWNTGAATTAKQSFTGLSIAVPAGSYLTIKILPPSWVTNPTGVLFGFEMEIEI